MASHHTTTTPPADALSPVLAIGLDTQDAIHDEVMWRLFGEQPGPSPRFGRYEVLGRLGAGAMGSVYLARDPELGREVAIKVLRLNLEKDRDRLTTEAQAMARLSHPNVVAVFDVGDHDGQLFVAMERVDGVNLRVWQEDERPWREVVRVYLDAARGLAAAHGAGIVHRDFKPDNVLLGRDGGVKVTDFGVSTVLPEEVLVQTLRDAEAASDAWQLATAGAGGTPVYMSPEQLSGLGDDPQADQFSFCVALFEALAGYRPFDDESIADLVQHRLDGQRRSPPPSSPVPAALWRIIVRGLSPDPTHRYASMADLGSAIDQCVRPAWRRRVALAGVGIVLASALGGALAYRQVQQAACTELSAEASRSWQDTRDRVQQGLMASAAGYAGATWLQVDHDLTTWVSSWERERADACVATDADPTAQIRRVLCLDEELRAFTGLLGVLSTADLDVAENAVRAASGLGDPSRCLDARWLAATQPLPPSAEIQPDVDTARRELAYARALSQGGKASRALSVAREQYTVARAVDYAPLAAESALQIGVAQETLGNYEEAESFLVDAVSHANAAGATWTGARASVALLNIVGARLERYDDGLVWARLADGYIERLGPTGSELLAQKHVTLAQLETQHGNPTEALLLLEDARSIYAQHEPSAFSWMRLWSVEARARSLLGESEVALELRQRVEKTTVERLGDRHPATGAARLSLGVALAQRGDLKGADTLLRSALELNTAVYGAEHPDNARVLNNLANLAVLSFDYAEAETLQRQAIALNKKVYGPNDPRLLRNLTNLGIVQLRQGKSDDALTTLEGVAKGFEESKGPEHLLLAEALLNLATATSANNDLPRTKALLLRAKGIFDATSPTAAGRGATLHNLANVTRTMGSLEEALRYAREAVQVVRESHGAENPELVKPLSLHTRLLFETGELVAARKAMETLLPRADEDAVDPGSAASILLTQADLLLLDGERAAARAASVRALARAETGTAEHQAAAQWLEAHP